MTRQQQRCLDFLRVYIAKRRISPSYAEIASHLGLKAKSGVHRIVAALETQGRIRRTAGTARNLELIASAPLHLRPETRARLDHYCLARGDRPDDVAEDAIGEFLDGAEDDPGCRSELTSAERERVL